MFATSCSVTRTRALSLACTSPCLSRFFTKKKQYFPSGQYRRIMTLRDIVALHLPHPQPKELILPGVTRREYLLSEGAAKGLPLVQQFLSESNKSIKDELIREHQKNYSEEGYLVRERVLNETDVVQSFSWEYQNSRLMCA